MGSRRTLWRVLLGLLVGALLGIFGVTPAHAAWQNQGDQWSEAKKPWTWVQDKASWSGLSAGSFTLGPSGCTIHAMTNILVEAGARNLGYTPKEFLEDVAKAGHAWGTQGGTGYATFKLQMADPNGKLQEQLVGTVTDDQMTNDVKAGAQFIFAAQSGSGGHWIATSGLDKDGKLLVHDSGFMGTKTYESMKAKDHRFGKTVYQARKYTLKDSAKWNAGAMGAGGTDTSSNSNELKKDSDGKNNKSKGVLKESELTGMPDQEDFSKVGDEVKLPTEKDMESSDGIQVKRKMAVLSSADNIRTDGGNYKHPFNVGIMIVGFILILYGVSLGLAWMVDRSTNITDAEGRFSFLTIASFGRLRYRPGDIQDTHAEIAGKKVRLVGLKEIIIRVGIVILAGMIVLSGVWSGWVLHVFWGLQDLYNNWNSIVNPGAHITQ